MGYIAHDAVIATTSDARPEPVDIEAFRASLPEDFRPLVIGPVVAPLNGTVSYAWLPDGSKEGWADSDQADEYRERFVALFNHRYEDGSSHDNVVEVRFGEDYADEHGAAIWWRNGKLSGHSLAEPCGCTPHRECDKHDLQADDAFKRSQDRSAD